MLKVPERTYVSIAASHYKRLFSLPRYQIIIGLTCIINIIGSLTAFYVSNRTDGLIFGVQVLILPTIIIDILLSSLVLKEDPIFDKRRTAGISLFISLIWVIILNIGALIQIVIRVPQIFENTTFFIVSLIPAFRYLIFIIVPKLKGWQLILTVLLQPLAYFCSLLIFWNTVHIQLFLAVFISSMILIVTSFFFVKLIDKKGVQVIGVGAITLFKNFLLNWITGVTSPLEEYFESIGLRSNALVSLIRFKKEHKKDSIIVVPMIHPGPFKNLGSSNLPNLIQTSLENQFNIVAVPHGTCGHESNLTSMNQCKNIINEVHNLAINVPDFFAKATKFVRVEQNTAKASCQIFGDVALITLTCAPVGMEDIPKDIGLKIRREGMKLGLRDLIIIDAHNSIGDSNDLFILSQTKINNLVSVALSAIKKTLRLKKYHFQMGAAKTIPKEFSIEDGFGPGGIVVFSFIINKQITSYIIIDGNNMINGLREQILSSLKDLINDGEILTTDTHVVNAVLTIDRGYYPVGEAIDQDKLITYIRETVQQSLNNIDCSKVSFNSGVYSVKMLGEDKLISLSTVVDVVYKYVRRIIPLTYLPSFLLAILFFIIILFNW